MSGGSNGFEGRIEIYYNGSWGTICDDDWDINDGNVICRMLGYQGATSVHYSAYFGEGTGEIVLDDVNCNGTENDVAHCSHSGFVINNCQHYEDAGVICATTGLTSV